MAAATKGPVKTARELVDAFAIQDFIAMHRDLLPGSHTQSGDGPDVNPPISLTELKQKYMKPGIKCIGCDINFGPAVRPGTNKRLERLVHFFESNLRYMSIDALITNVHSLYQELIYIPEMENGHDQPLWELESVARHIYYCYEHPILEAKKTLEKIRLIEAKLSESLFNGDQGDKANNAIMTQYMKLKLDYLKYMDTHKTI